MAVIGGIAVLAMIAVIVASVCGRALVSLLYSAPIRALVPDLGPMVREAGFGAITGDFELVEAAMAFAIYCFMPLALAGRAHAAVDILVNRLPKPISRALSLIADIALAVFFVLLAVMLAEGMASKLRSGQVTLMLQFPLWWAQAAAFFPAVVTACVAVWLALAHTWAAWRGDDAALIFDPEDET